MGERPAGTTGLNRARTQASKSGSKVSAPPPSGAALLETPIARSGLPGGSTLGRVGKRLGVATVRDLLFHLPRRYDDLREMRKLGDLLWVEDGEVVSARVRVADIRVEASFRRRVQRTIAVLEDETGTIEATLPLAGS